MKEPMEVTQADSNITWPLWQRVGFRFLAVFLLLIVSPWGWLRLIPGGSWLLEPFYELLDRFVGWVNAAFLHVRPVLVPTNGSGDTSYAWAELATFFWLALIGCIIWTVLDWRRRDYVRLNYWLCLMVRYNLILYSLTYGYGKIFLMQMPAPDISALATPLGDFLPMRLSWMFIGYSGPYQAFCGCAEVLVGLLLLYRRTATLGALLAVGVFANVAMLNLSYDIPVKIFSLELLGMSVFLLAQERRRLAAFFLQNRHAEAGHLYIATLSRKWMRTGRVVAKVAFILLAMILPFIEVWRYQNDQRSVAARTSPFPYGLYDVTAYVMNADTIRPTAAIGPRWNNLVFDAGGKGSIKTDDSTLAQRYGRAYFLYEADTAGHSLVFKKQTENVTIMRFRYAVRDSNRIELWGSRDQDRLYVALQRNLQRYPLADRPFNWLSEGVR